MAFDKDYMKPTGRTTVKGTDFASSYTDLARQVTDSHYDAESAKQTITFMNYTGTIFHLVGQIFANMLHNTTTLTPKEVREKLSKLTWDETAHAACCLLVHNCYKRWESDIDKWDTEPLHRWQAHEFTSTYCFPPTDEELNFENTVNWLPCAFAIQSKDSYAQAINHGGNMFECIYTSEKQRDEQKNKLKLMKHGEALEKPR